jgi:predicted ATPase/class 3 adenylate cyclase/DNA-binding CsgD family transcriptional regulator
MFRGSRLMEAGSMNDVDPVNRSDPGVSELVPTGTVTLLLADAEGSTRLWQTNPEDMTAAVALLDKTLADLVVAHHGVRPIEQGEGDSFVVAFARASDAAACALALQRAPLAPIRLRIGLHTGEVQLRDEGNYVGPTINRTGRLRNLAHGGQIVLSGITSDLVADRLPADAWLADLGVHAVRDLPRPEHVMQLCHPDLHNEFPPLRTSESVDLHHLPKHITTFVGRTAQIAEVRELLGQDRLVTLTGAGGIGKTRLAVQVATQIAAEFADGAWCVDLAPITDSGLVPVTVARALGLPDQPGRTMIDTVVSVIGGRRMLLVLDNCEHLLDAAAALTTELLSRCGTVTILATSREPLGVPGEATWRVPPLSLADEAIELFTDRAQRVRRDFAANADSAGLVLEICRRLDGMPLALELASARVRGLSLQEILDSLHDRFRILTGGARTAVRRQQTLRASVDWSYALLTESERVVFRRLAVFPGGFDLAAAQAVVGDSDLHPHQILDLLMLLVDKSLVFAESAGATTRYRTMETVRHYALEKLGESGEADRVRDRHRDHYTAVAALFDQPTSADHQQRVELAETEIDNLRAAFAWSRERADTEAALRLASSLQPLWLSRGRIMEGLSWYYAVLGDADPFAANATPAVCAGATADRAMLMSVINVPNPPDLLAELLTVARDVGDPGLLVRALIACGSSALFNVDVARPYLDEALGLARATGDRWRLSQVLWWRACVASIAGEPHASLEAGSEGVRLADEIGDHFISRMCRFWGIGTALLAQGDLAAASEQFRGLVAEAEAAHDPFGQLAGLTHLAHALSYMGDTGAARAAATSAVNLGAEFGGFIEGIANSQLARAALAEGDIATATEASEAARQQMGEVHIPGGNVNPIAEVALARGDLEFARLASDETVARARGVALAVALMTRARVAIAQGEFSQAERDAHQALAIALSVDAHPATPETLECLAEIARVAESHRESARLFGAATALRREMGIVRFKVYDDAHDVSITSLRNVLSDDEFESAWAEGAALSATEAIAYAQRGRGERKRPSSGWASLTPTEHDVVRLVAEGLGNKDIAARLFISPRTVATHLTHVYAKLGLTSRVQLAQEAGPQR